MKPAEAESQEQQINPKTCLLGAIILTPLLLGCCYLMLAPAHINVFLLYNFWGYLGAGPVILALNYFFSRIESTATRRIILGFLMGGLALMVLYYMYIAPPFTGGAYWWVRYGKHDGYLGEGMWDGAFLFSYVLACSIILWALCHYLYLPRRAWPGLWNLLAFFLGLMGSTYALDLIIDQIRFGRSYYYLLGMITGFVVLTGLFLFLARRTKWPPLFILVLYGGLCLFITVFLLFVYYCCSSIVF